MRLDSRSCVSDQYYQRYPEIKLDIVATDSLADLFDEGFEAAIRIGTLASPDVVARPLAPYRLVLCASPAYVHEHGAPTTPHALREHHCLTYAYPPRSEWHAAHAHWMLEGPGGPMSICVDGRLKIDSAEALRRATLSGLGIAMLPSMLIHEDIRDARLVEIMPDFAAPERSMNLLYPQQKQKSPKLRSFTEFVVDRFGAETASRM